MQTSEVYYVDAGIVNNIGHNLETIEFLRHHIDEKIDFNVIAGKRFSGAVKNIDIWPLLRYGSPHWSVVSDHVQRLSRLAQLYPHPIFERLIDRSKTAETKYDLERAGFEENALVIINSVELDDAYRQCVAMLDLQPALRIKVIMHYSPFIATSTAIRPKLKKPIERIRAIPASDTRISFYADTDKLCQAYAALLGKPVTLLPIPHAKRGQGATRQSPVKPYRVLYFGTYSEAKTPHLIPEVIRRVSPTTPLSWEVCITYLAKNRVIDAFERELRALEVKTSQPIYHIGPFSTERIEQMFADSDILLIPYHSHDYEIQSSGVVMEALVSGKIPLISRSMVDADMLTAIDPMLVFRPNNEVDMVASLEYAAANYQALQEKLRPLRERMEAFHNPASFIRILLG